MRAREAWRSLAVRGMDAARFFRVEFWFVSVFPAWVGWCLATQQMVPEQDLLLSWLSGGGSVADVAGWGARHARALLALLTLGPFLGGAIMVMNDYHDREVDVFNPKKATSPLVRGTATPARARAWMLALSLATLLGGFALDVRFGALLALGLLLSYLYSAPPVRLKARPLGDVLVNAVGYGGITTLAGWGLGSGWQGHWPLGAALVVALAIAAGYIPTVMMDVETDRRSGLRTTAVAHGMRASWLIGLQTLVAANVMMAALALLGVYVAPAFILVQLPFLAIELTAYMTLVRREEPALIFLGGSLVTVALFGNLAAFLVVYTGAV